MRHARKIGKRAALLVAVILTATIWARAQDDDSGGGAGAGKGGDASVTATVDRTEMDPNDTVYLTISSRSSTDVDVKIPSRRELETGPLAGFQILKDWEESGARAQMMSDPLTGGMKFETVHTRAHHYVLQPKGAGTVRIPAVNVQVGGKPVATKPIAIRVAPGASQNARRDAGGSARGGGRGAPQAPQPNPQGEEDEDEDLFALLLRRQGIPAPPGFGGPGGARPSDQGFRTQPLNPQDAFFVQVDVDKTEAYVGEQVTASWYLYTRGQIRDLDTLKYPSLRGFWKEDIEIATHLNFTQEVVNGIPYKKALLASFALFPIKEGTAIVDPYTAKCTVIAFDDPFGALSGKTYAFTKSSREAKITVRALPTEGRPADFSGAVGDFQLSARVEDPKVIANQPFSLKVRFEGRGNAKVIEMPPFQPPDGMELYDTQNESKFFRTGTSFKDFAVLLIPRRAGEFTLPAVTASVFDPAQKKYVQRRAEPIVVIAQPGAPGATSPSASLPLAGDQERKDAPAKPYQPAPDPEYRASLAVAPPVQALALGGGFLAALIGLFLRARAKLGWGKRREGLARRVRARFKALDALAEKGDWRGVGREGTNAIYWALGEATGQGGANVELEKLLMRAPPSVRRELAEEAPKILEKFQALAFAPEETVGALKDKAALAELLKRTEALLERAASLAESAERSNGSGPSRPAS